MYEMRRIANLLSIRIGKYRLGGLTNLRSRFTAVIKYSVISGDYLFARKVKRRVFCRIGDGSRG